jgi:phosphocarrier protein
VPCRAGFVVYAADIMRREVEIVNELGLHARPAAEFVRCVQTFECEITIRKGEEHFSAGSILEVLSANLDCGARVILEAIGDDAEKAIDRLEELLHEFKRQEERGLV